jgi:hypothetical protein
MGIRELNIVPAEVVIRNAEGKRERVPCGFHVTALASWDMGETYEGMTHPAIFRTKERAERFRERMRAEFSRRYNAGECQVNTKHWIIAAATSLSYYVRLQPGRRIPEFSR